MLFISIDGLYPFKHTQPKISDIDTIVGFYHELTPKVAQMFLLYFYIFFRIYAFYSQIFVSPALLQIWMIHKDTFKFSW